LFRRTVKYSSQMGNVASEMTASNAIPSHHRRSRTPISTNGARVGLMRTSSATQPNRIPIATNAATHMLVLPQMTML
jgi:hypothetical protein